MPPRLVRAGHSCAQRFLKGENRNGVFFTEPNNSVDVDVLIRVGNLPRKAFSDLFDLHKFRDRRAQSLGGRAETFQESLCCERSDSVDR